MGDRREAPIESPLGPPVERLEYGSQLFAVVYSRGTLPTKAPLEAPKKTGAKSGGLWTSTSFNARVTARSGSGGGAADVPRAPEDHDAHLGAWREA